MLEILKLSKRNTDYILFHPDKKFIAREPSATYSNHEGRIVGYHWVVSKDFLDQKVERWQEYERVDK